MWLTALCARAATAQPAHGPLPSFEEASLTISLLNRQLAGAPGGAPALPPLPRIRGGPGTSSPGEMVCMGCPLELLAAYAFETQAVNVRRSPAPSSPAKRGSAPPAPPDLYDVIAKVPRGSTPQQATQMLQRLLYERFQFGVHVERQNAQVWVLTAASRDASDAIKAKTAVAPGGSASALPDGPALIPELTPDGIFVIAAQHRTMGDLAGALSEALQRPVVDLTGLDGAYNFTAAWTSEPRPQKIVYPEGVTEIGSSPEDAVRPLGLKLATRTMAIEIVFLKTVARYPRPD
jgi:uncharacterized protein (TIGR03435 family)